MATLIIVSHFTDHVTEFPVAVGKLSSLCMSHFIKLSLVITAQPYSWRWTSQFPCFSLETQIVHLEAKKAQCTILYLLNGVH